MRRHRYCAAHTLTGRYVIEAILTNNIRYLVTQYCEAQRAHRGVLGFVSKDTETPREDEQALISKVDSCEYCTFHSAFFDPRTVQEIRKTTPKPSWERSTQKLLAKIGFGTNLCVLIVITVLLYVTKPQALTGENFEAYALATSVGFLCLSTVFDEYATKKAKLSNLFAFALAVVFYINKIT